MSASHRSAGGTDLCCNPGDLARFRLDLRSPWMRRLRRAGLVVGRVSIVLALPFWLLVRGSLLAEEALGVNPWLALTCGAVAAQLCLATTGWWIWRRWTGRDRFRVIGTRIVLPIVVGFCLYVLVWVSSPNVKSDEVRSFYRSMHPVLRVALGTLIVVDAELVITDIAREPDDYRAMGLPVRSRSLHYPQEDGWVHAADLRTRNRGFVRNGLLRAYFWGMGFDTLRHGGPADHLHVSLPAD